MFPKVLFTLLRKWRFQQIPTHALEYVHGEVVSDQQEKHGLDLLTEQQKIENNRGKQFHRNQEINILPLMAEDWT